jgi:hypothetical protein
MPLRPHWRPRPRQAIQFLVGVAPATAHPGHQAHLRLARAQEVAGERARGDCNAQKGCSEAGPVITRIQEADAATCVRIQELGTQPMRRGFLYVHMLQARLLHVFRLWLKRRASARENMQNSATMPRHEPEARRTGARRTGARIDAKLKTPLARHQVLLVSAVYSFCLRIFVDLFVFLHITDHCNLPTH